MTHREQFGVACLSVFVAVGLVAEVCAIVLLFSMGGWAIWGGVALLLACLAVAGGIWGVMA